jgi:hypothetical protein
VVCVRAQKEGREALMPDPWPTVEREEAALVTRPDGGATSGTEEH